MNITDVHNTTSAIHTRINFIGMNNHMASYTDLLEIMGNADRIFICGAGRSGLVGKMFAMRLIQLGLKAYVVGETTTPNIKAAGDILVFLSFTGETASLIPIHHKAKSLGVKTVCITGSPDSTLAQGANRLITIGGTGNNLNVCYSKIPELPLGSAFEISLLLFLEGVIACYMKEYDIEESYLKERHANLE